MNCKSRVIRIAERQANLTGKTFYIMKLCGRYDFIDQDAYDNQTEKAVYIVVPND